MASWCLAFSCESGENGDSGVMAELCPKHKLILAPDGRCVLCRRSAGVFGLDQAQESWLSRALTVILGACMLGALVSLFAVQRMGPSSQQTPVWAQPVEGAQRAVTSSTRTRRARPRPTTPTASKKPVTQPKWKEVGVDRETFISARSEVELVMYAAPWCYICDGARTFLDARGITLVEHDVDLDPEAARQLERLNPSASLPTFQLQGETIVGFNAWDLADRVDELAAERIVAGR